LLFETRQIAFQRRLAAAQHDIMNFVVFQIAERGCISVPAREEVLVNTQDLRAGAAAAFPGQQLQIPLKPALNGGARQTLAFGEATAADAVEMLLTHATPKRLGRAQARLNPRKPLPEAAAAGPAQPLARF